MSDAGVKSADRALAVLQHLSDVGDASFSELIDSLGLPKSSASALLATLEAAGWIERDARRRYAVGLRAWQVGRTYRGHADIAERAKPLMDALARDTGETVQLARLDGMENVYVAISQSPHPMRLASSEGMRLPSHATGIGKALLSQLDPTERARRVSSASLERLTDRTITDPERLLVALSECALTGVAIDDEEYVEGCRCVAVPLHTDALGVVTALSVTMPAFRTGPDWPADILAPLRRTSGALRDLLGLPAVAVRH
jgi:IclR family transcriptional regulator, acetate operon repressor